MVGFLWRAIFGSLRNVLRGRMSLRDLATNWAAALNLPFVHLGVAKDFWRNFNDRYVEIENGLPSTLFVIPFKGCAGRTRTGAAPAFRAAGYGARDLADAIKKVTGTGHEVGLHGIDAWLDHSKGSEEIAEIRRVTGASEIGVRMHWLYYDRESPKALEEAGAAYDSSIGYNETVGYRAGTTQAYKPPAVSRLLELPLHIMDTALFYPTHLDLSSTEAKAVFVSMLEDAARHGGCLTVNWHDRSLAPERLWGASYRELVQEMKTRGAWFATAGQAVSWFRKRRSATFRSGGFEHDGAHTEVAVRQCDSLPSLRLRVNKARKFGESGVRRLKDYVDLPVNQGADDRVRSEAGK